MVKIRFLELYSEWGKGQFQEERLKTKDKRDWSSMCVAGYSLTLVVSGSAGFVWIKVSEINLWLYVYSWIVLVKSKAGRMESATSHNLPCSVRVKCQDLYFWNLFHKYILQMQNNELCDTGGEEAFSWTCSYKKPQSGSIILRSDDFAGHGRCSMSPVLLCILMHYHPETWHHLQGTLFEPLGHMDHQNGSVVLGSDVPIQHK